MKQNPIVPTTAALLVLSVGALLSVPARAAANEAAATPLISDSIDDDTAKPGIPAAQKAELDRAKKELDAAKKQVEGSYADLDAKLADARARLDEAAHEVAELSMERGRPLMDRIVMFDGGGRPHAVLGVQLDDKSSDNGARVKEVSPGGPADEAGLHPGDVIVTINDKDVKGEEPARLVLHLMRDVAPDSKVKVRVMRDGKQQDFLVTARSGMFFAGVPMPPRPPRPPRAPRAPEAPEGPVLRDFGDRSSFVPPTIIRGPLGDMELVTLTPALGRYFGTEKGVLVVRAPRDQDLKLEDGDVILAIDGREPTSGSHATRILSSYQPGEKISIKLMRQHKAVSLETTLPESGQGPERKVRLIRSRDMDGTTGASRVPLARAAP